MTPWTAACQASLSFAISWIFPTQGWNPGLLNCRQILYHLSHQGNSCIFIMCVHVKSLQLCPTLCNPMVCSPPGPSVHRILQARIMESVAMPSSRDLLDPGMEPISLMSPALAGRFFTTSTTWEATPSYGLANSMSSIFSVHPECNHFSPPLLPVLWSKPQVSSKIFDLYFETDENYLLIEPLLTLLLHPWLLKAYSTR